MSMVIRLDTVGLSELASLLGSGAGLGWVSTKSWLAFLTTRAVICAASCAVLAVGMRESESEELVDAADVW